MKLGDQGDGEPPSEDNDRGRPVPLWSDLRSRGVGDLEEGQRLEQVLFNRDVPVSTQAETLLKSGGRNTASADPQCALMGPALDISARGAGCNQT